MSSGVTVFVKGDGIRLKALVEEFVGQTLVVQEDPFVFFGEVFGVPITMEIPHQYVNDASIRFEEFPTCVGFSRSAAQGDPEERHEACRLMAVLLSRHFLYHRYSSMVVEDAGDILETNPSFRVVRLVQNEQTAAWDRIKNIINKM